MSVEIRNKLADLQVEQSDVNPMVSDNLAIVLCTYFSDHVERPDNDPVNETGWGEWVMDKTDEALDLIGKQLAL